MQADHFFAAVIAAGNPGSAPGGSSAESRAAPGEPPRGSGVRMRAAPQAAVPRRPAAQPACTRSGTGSRDHLPQGAHSHQHPRQSTQPYMKPRLPGSCGGRRDVVVLARSNQHWEAGLHHRAEQLAALQGVDLVAHPGHLPDRQRQPGGQRTCVQAGKQARYGEAATCDDSGEWVGGQNICRGSRQAQGPCQRLLASSAAWQRRCLSAGAPLSAPGPTPRCSAGAGTSPAGRG